MKYLIKHTIIIRRWVCLLNLGLMLPTISMNGQELELRLITNIGGTGMTQRKNFR
jgi:hypothetical protein